jgi:hypothetical protein
MQWDRCSVQLQKKKKKKKKFIITNALHKVNVFQTRTVYS